MNTKEVVKEILTKLQDGWNNANGTAYAEPFADTAEFVDIRGTLHQQSTRQYLGEAHQGVFKGIYKNSRIQYDLIQAWPINEKTIFANARAELHSPEGPLAGKSASTISLILTKSGNAWQIRTFHNTLVAKQ